MKNKTIITIGVLVLIVALLAACQKLTSTSKMPGMESYTNYEAGYGIQFPGPWDRQVLPDQNEGAIHGESFTGPEGGVEVYWGKGFGGTCTTETEQVQLADGKETSCHVTNGDGTEEWSQISHEEIGGNSFSVRAYTSDAQQPSQDLVFQVLSTLTFNVSRRSGL